MKKLLIYLRDYKKESILAPAFKMLEATFDLLVPLVMAAIINTGIANKDKGYILSHCGLLILLGVIGLNLQYHRTVFCGESIRWILYEGAACAVLTYPVPWICGDGQAGYFHTDHANDE